MKTGSSLGVSVAIEINLADALSATEIRSFEPLCDVMTERQRRTTSLIEVYCKASVKSVMAPEARFLLVDNGGYVKRL